ncbi:aspartate carbamoyltransferase catalytic subunit [Cognatishimia sp. F0-27]|uniref:aspartate carbamoyltransferase catalytic subunit n=1 Tax=Cognatishimia sp. F0-27 TaxID=2816855 RepID=UPI001D0C83F0|nr:aspartate carbamoyltransferase catalytic subunit [Cognatishimia sp. F0-27]MCC1494211.1 aspartate carbamoyltransferase catalytic subunit [Cognatishimia sp. F0-27]
MTEIKINGSERDVVRLFHIDLPREAVERFTTQAGTGEWPLKYALGAQTLRAGFVEVIDLRDLEPMTLSQYLGEAYGVRSAELKDMRGRIDALKGHVVVTPSQAFAQTSQTLTIATPLRWIGTFGEIKAAARGAALRAESASGNAAAPPHDGGLAPVRWLPFAVLFLAVLLLPVLYVVTR